MYNARNWKDRQLHSVYFAVHGWNRLWVNVRTEIETSERNKSDKVSKLFKGSSAVYGKKDLV